MLSVKALRLKAFGQTCEDNGNIAVLGKLHSFIEKLVNSFVTVGDEFMFAAAAAGGDVLVKDVIPKHLEATTAKLVEAGCKVEEFDDAVRIISDGKLHHTQVTTLPYPGFPTDMQPQMAVILGIAEGTSTVTESIFENRFKYVDELTRMGANIKVESNIAIINAICKNYPPFLSLQSRKFAYFSRFCGFDSATVISYSFSCEPVQSSHRSALDRRFAFRCLQAFPR